MGGGQARGRLALEVLLARFAICRLPPDAEIPEWALRGSFSSISRSASELSIVCEEDAIPPRLRCERGWRAIKVLEPLDQDAVGVVAALAEPLTRANVSIFAISTFETDYLLVRNRNLAKSLKLLREAGHRFDRAPEPAPSEAPRRPAPPRAPREPAPPAPPPAAAAPPREPAPPAPPLSPTSAPRRAVSDDEAATPEGLFSGAIAQHPVATTDQSFASLGLSEAGQRIVAEIGYRHPTPVQVEVIPHALAGRDVVGLAETGSGKTAAFGLPLAEQLTRGSGSRALILCPTREIALQTKAFFDAFPPPHRLETVAVIGGVRIGPQSEALRRQPDVVIATPGRLADHMRRGNVDLAAIEKLVLDEADHMLDLGFLPQIREILQQIPTARQTMMFSATMPAPIERLAQTFMQDPVRVDMRPDGQAAEGIEHRLYLVRDEDRKKCLFALLKEVEGSTLIFTRRKLHTEWLARQLELAQFEVERIHSDRSQGQRVEALRGFRKGEHRVLVATDVAARGLDIPAIRHVINYEMPDGVEEYVHRAGRTARGAAGGVVSSIATWQDKELIRDIELALGQKLPRRTVAGVEPYTELKQRKQVRRRRLL